MSSNVPSDLVDVVSPRRRSRGGEDRHAGLGGESIDHVALGGAQVWLVDLRTSDEQRYARARALLSHDEHDRARAIRGEQAARRFVLARAALRVRLGHALAIPPEHVTLRVGEHGKPEIAPPPPGAGVGGTHVSQGLPRFNLAHRDGVALLTIHRRYDIGVDIERIAPEPERPWRKLLERICHPCEAHEAMAEARALGSRAFYERWVGKEAVLKALGLGLRVSPAAVPLRRDGAGVLRVEQLPAERGRGHALASALAGCKLATVRTPDGLVGALALNSAS